MTDPAPRPVRVDPAERRARLEALKAQRATASMPAPAQRARRGHAALAGRVLAAGLTAGTAVGLIGVLAAADQAADETVSTIPPAPAATPVAAGPGSSTTVVAGAAPAAATAPAAPAPTGAPAPTNAPAPQAAPPQATAPQATAPAAAPAAAPAPAPAPVVTAPPATAAPAPPVTAPPAPPVTVSGGS